MITIASASALYIAIATVIPMAWLNNYIMAVAKAKLFPKLQLQAKLKTKLYHSGK